MVGQRVKRVAKWVCAVAVAMGAGSLSADERYVGGPLYAQAGIGIGGVRVGELDFYPAFVTATLGAYVLPGIGLELHADAGFREGRDDGFELELPLAYGAGVRFESPPERGLAGYIVLGYVAFEAEQALRENPSATTVDEDFAGGRVSIGLVQRFERVPGLLLSAEYRKYAVEDGLDLDALVIGLRVNAP